MGNTSSTFATIAQRSNFSYENGGDVHLRHFKSNPMIVLGRTVSQSFTNHLLHTQNGIHLGRITLSDPNTFASDIRLTFTNPKNDRVSIPAHLFVKMGTLGNNGEIKLMSTTAVNGETITVCDTETDQIGVYTNSDQPRYVHFFLNQKPFVPNFHFGNFKVTISYNLYSMSDSDDQKVIWDDYYCTERDFEFMTDENGSADITPSIQGVVCQMTFFDNSTTLPTQINDYKLTVCEKCNPMDDVTFSDTTVFNSFDELKSKWGCGDEYHVDELDETILVTLKPNISVSCLVRSKIFLDM